VFKFIICVVDYSTNILARTRSNPDSLRMMRDPFHRDGWWLLLSPRNDIHRQTEHPSFPYPRSPTTGLCANPFGGTEHCDDAVWFLGSESLAPADTRGPEEWFEVQLQVHFFHVPLGSRTRRRISWWGWTVRREVEAAEGG
jgi:hypothetical protein